MPSRGLYRSARHDRFSTTTEHVASVWFAESLIVSISRIAVFYAAIPRRVRETFVSTTVSLGIFVVALAALA
jgi:hypothetical protein